MNRRANILFQVVMIVQIVMNKIPDKTVLTMNDLRVNNEFFQDQLKKSKALLLQDKKKLFKTNKSQIMQLSQQNLKKIKASNRSLKKKNSQTQKKNIDKQQQNKSIIFLQYQNPKKNNNQNNSLKQNFIIDGQKNNLLKSIAKLHQTHKQKSIQVQKQLSLFYQQAEKDVLQSINVCKMISFIKQHKKDQNKQWANRKKHQTLILKQSSQKMKQFKKQINVLDRQFSRIKREIQQLLSQIQDIGNENFQQKIDQIQHKSEKIYQYLSIQHLELQDKKYVYQQYLVPSDHLKLKNQFQKTMDLLQKTMKESSKLQNLILTNRQQSHNFQNDSKIQNDDNVFHQYSSSFTNIQTAQRNNIQSEIRTQMTIQLNALNQLNQLKSPRIRNVTLNNIIIKHIQNLNCQLQKIKQGFIIQKKKIQPEKIISIVSFAKLQYKSWLKMTWLSKILVVLKKLFRLILPFQHRIAITKHCFKLGSYIQELRQQLHILRNVVIKNNHKINLLKNNINLSIPSTQNIQTKKQKDVK